MIVLYRLFRYQTSWVSETADELFDAEFAHETEEMLSVYEIERSVAPQVHVEHYAAAGNDPPRNGGGFDCGSFQWEVTPDDPGGLFATRRSAHRLIQTKSEDDRKRFASETWSLICQDAPAKVEVRKDDMRAHVHSRVQRSDAEWIGFLEAASDDWKKYPKPLATPPDDKSRKTPKPK